MNQSIKIFFAICFVILTSGVSAQDFDKNLTTARSTYSAGNLQDARFAMEQMLRDLDVQIGKEILKMLPQQLGALSSNAKEDNVSGSGVGLFVQRVYGVTPKSVNLEIINNSPLITGINAILSVPVLGGMMRDENQKQIKIQGYKALLTRSVDSETGKTDYDLQIPMNNTLVTLKSNDTTESEITNWANSIPLSKIQQLAQ